jgi:transmembrane sensor
MKTAREIENEAARWLVRNDQGDLASSAIAACESWLAADLRHRAAYVRMRTAWRRASELGPRMRPHDCRVDPDLLKPQAQRLTTRRRFAIALAAGVAAVAIGLATVLLLQRDRGCEAIDTEFGTLTEVVFIDGTPCASPQRHRDPRAPDRTPTRK